MRRLLPALAALGLSLALVSPALAHGRVPAGVRRISVTLTFPPQTGAPRRAVHRTLTGTVAVHRVVHAVDRLRAAKVHGVCPMMIRLGPQLTVTFRGSSGRSLAQTKVEVALGSHARSGSSYCFPISYTGAGPSQRLVGNGYVRLIGRLIGTPIS